MIKTMDKIRFVTANFTRLKGLNMALIGVLMFSTSVWTNHKPGDLSLLIVMLVLMLPLKILVDRYYRRAFGQVGRDPKARRRETLISLMFGALGLAAFVLDTTEILPVSTVGLLFAVTFGWDYLWLNRGNPEKFLAYYLAFAALTALVSLLPLLGMGAFWEVLGFRSSIPGVLAVIGLLLIAIGLLDHFFLVRAFQSKKEFGNGEPV